jgi:glycogen operon protein
MTAGTQGTEDRCMVPVIPGRAHPLGARDVDGGVNFSVFLENAGSVELLLFARPEDPEPASVLPLFRDFHFWHAFVHGVAPGTAYAFRAAGPAGGAFAFDREKVLLDPYARCVVASRWDRAAATRPGDNVDSPTSGVARPGAFAGMIEKIPYLVELGVTAVELLPIAQFDETVRDYWGYNPIAYFAPHAPYGDVDEFRDLVKALHRAGIEIILDVVYNHTGEGGVGGPTISLRGLGNEAYYMHSQTDPRVLLDFSGTGNTLDVNDPIATKLVFDSLCYWVEELHVDGFRFDLGSVLTRGPDGGVMRFPPVVALTELADALGETKLIAEAWDAGGPYNVGSFPGRRWSEWNGRFRDDVRRFVRGEAGLVGAVATRIAGSSGAPGWNDPGSRVLSFTLGGFAGEPDLHVILNMDPQDLDFELPAIEARRWLRVFDTARPAPDDACEPGSEQPLDDPSVYRAAGRSAVVLVSAPIS